MLKLKIEFQKPCTPSFVMQAFDAVKQDFSPNFRVEFKGSTGGGKRFAFTVSSPNSLDFYLAGMVGQRIVSHFENQQHNEQ